MSTRQGARRLHAVRGRHRPARRRRRVAATVTATGSAYFGFQGWPHAATAPIDRTVTYTNSGDTAVTLQPDRAGRDRRRSLRRGPGAPTPAPPPPDGMFSLSADPVTVPAHGTRHRRRDREAGDGRQRPPALPRPDRRDRLAGTCGPHPGRPLHRGRAAQPAPERSATGPAGPAAATWSCSCSASRATRLSLVGYDGELDVRLRAGTYSAFTYPESPAATAPDSRGVALLGDPELVLDRDRDVTLDARQARRGHGRAARPAATEDRVM